MRKDDKRRSRELAVYEAVLSLIGQGCDPASLTVQQIADAAGIGKGTVYEYFASKEEILTRMADYTLHSEMSRLTEALAPCCTLVRAEDPLLDYLSGLAGERLGKYQVIARTFARSGAVPEDRVTPELIHGLEQCFGSLVRRLRAAGEIPPENDDLYCMHAIASACVMGAIALSPCARQFLDHVNTERVLARTRRLLDKALR